jgi:hypothetical protein
VTVKRISLDYDLQLQQRTVRCELKYKRGCLIALSQRIVSDLARSPTIIRVCWA